MDKSKPQAKQLRLDGEKKKKQISGFRKGSKIKINPDIAQKINLPPLPSAVKKAAKKSATKKKAATSKKDSPKKSQFRKKPTSKKK